MAKTEKGHGNAVYVSKYCNWFWYVWMRFYRSS